MDSGKVITQTKELAKRYEEICEENSRLRRALAGSEQAVCLCKNCKYFVQHYVLMEREQYFMRIDNGHCTRGRKRDRQGYMRGCEYFEILTKREGE